MSEESTSSGSDGLERKATPHIMTLRKKMRISETDSPCTSEEDVSVIVKRKVRNDGDGLVKRKAKKRRLDLLRCDQEVASSSTDVDTESSNISVEDVRKKGVKRKASADGEAPVLKKTRSQDLKEETKDETREDLLVEALRGQ
ncbi:uncharacterized protein LOC144464637 [Epinephelus lanceolatus]